jgi:hypothetical protein
MDRLAYECSCENHSYSKKKKQKEFVDVLRAGPVPVKVSTHDSMDYGGNNDIGNRGAMIVPAMSTTKGNGSEPYVPRQ